MLNSIENNFSLRKIVLEEIYDTLQNYLYTACVMLQETLSNNGKVIIFDDNQNSYISNEIENKIIKKFKNLKIGIPAIALKKEPLLIDTFGIDKIFEKQIETIINKTDLLLGISNDGNSKNILRALSLGKNLGCRTIGISGNNGGYMNDFCDINISIPNNENDIIEETILMICNIIINSTEMKNG